MQFVWVYWHAGARNDELRWSMRSIVKNFQGPVDLMLVGDKPNWYEGPHIPVGRIPKGPCRAFRDSLNKLMVAVASDSVADEFVWMMDDIYLANPATESQLKTSYYQGEFTPEKVNNGNPGNKWQRLKYASMKVLLENNLPLRDYATHLPHYVEKSKFKEIVCRFDPGNSDRTLLWEILYGNCFATEHQPSRNILFRTTRKKPYSSFKNQNRLFINNGNHAWNEALRGFLYESFPTPSPYEIQEPAAPYDWYRTAPPLESKEAVVSKKKIVALVPYRPTQDRESAWKWVRQYLRHRCTEIVVADSSTEKFNRANAINNAFRKIETKYDNDTVLIIADADCAVTNTRFQEACKEALTSSKLVIPHNRLCRMTPEQSDEILQKHSPTTGPKGTWFRSNRIKRSVSGLIAIRKDCFQKVNGFDEQFIDWGGEDNAFKFACDRILGKSTQMDGPLFHFWHQPVSDTNTITDSQVRYLAYRSATAHEIKTILCTKGLR